MTTDEPRGNTARKADPVASREFVDLAAGPGSALRAAVVDPTVTGSGRLPMRPLAVPYPDEVAARGGDPAASPWWRSLDGEWRFRTFGGLDELDATTVAAEGHGDARWDRIQVPGAWTLQRDEHGERFGRPHYTNVMMPFDADPPAVPERNPVGVYRRTVTVPREWSGRRVVLRVGAAESVCGVWVGGRHVGVSTDSRLPSEFDVTPFVRPGRRVAVALVVVRWSAHSWVEDQDQWWHGGIQRSVSLYSTAPSHLSQLWIVPSLDGAHDDRTGRLDASIVVGGPACREPGWTVDVTVETIGRRPRRLATTGATAVPTWDGTSEAAAVLSGMFVSPGTVRRVLQVPGIEPWSHETPQRYRAVVHLRDPDGRDVEVTSLVIGFRSVEVRDNELLLNGRPVLIHGVNLHEHDPARGRAVGRELTRRDLLMMKAHNLNAVRAAHYPHDEHLAELCDELGLLLVDEADVESHARQTSLCDDPRYATSIVERVQRMVQRDVHHPSIVLWSLGNESGDGAAHDAAAAWVRRQDPTRPLHYEGPLMHDLYAAAPVTDVVCPMYPAIVDIVAWARSGRDRRRPLIMCEYSHAMGASNGSLADYWDAIESTHGLQGGFIWEWVEHGLALDGGGPGGRTVWGYGGDFGDEPNDANFVCDGLVSADRVPHPALEEVRWIGRPVAVEPADERGRRLRVRSRRWFTDTSDLSARWSLTVDGDEVDSGVLDLPPVPPQESVVVPRPCRVPPVAPGSEVHLDISWAQRAATPWSPRGTVVAREQLAITAPTRPTPRPAARGGVRADVRPGTDRGTGPGDGTSAGGLPEGVDPFAVTPTMFRALTDNDGLRQGWMSGHTGHLRRWVTDQGLDRAAWHPGTVRRRVQDGATVSTSTGELRAAGVPDAVTVQRRVVERGDGWTHLRVSLEVPDALADPPRVGVEWLLPARFEVLEWFGDGPHECYPDRRAAATVGRWTSTVTESYVDHVVPQEHGHRTGLRWLALRPARGAGGGLLVVADPDVAGGTPGFAARHHSDAALWAARHTSDLRDEAVTALYLDAAQRGLGTASCGPDTLDRYRIAAGTHVVSVWCRTLRRGDDPAGLAREVRGATVPAP